MINDRFDAIIVGGSYSGLAAAMGLGRALRNVLLIDSGAPANRFTDHSHNFLTQDGIAPGEIAAIGRKQVEQYKTISMLDGTVVTVEREEGGFLVALASGATFRAAQIIFATGIVDIMPEISGFAECWGKSVLHCPYCHGYEIRNAKTGILGNGEYAFEFGSLISNWTPDLTIYTNGVSTLTREQVTKLTAHGIQVVENEIERLEHQAGYLRQIVFRNGKVSNVAALYARPAFKQHCDLPQALGCGMTPEGYIKIDAAQRTSVPGIYACGDNVTRIRTVANAIAMGTTTAITLNKDMITQSF